MYNSKRVIRSRVKRTLDVGRGQIFVLPMYHNRVRAVDDV